MWGLNEVAVSGDFELSRSVIDLWIADASGAAPPHSARVTRGGSLVCATRAAQRARNGNDSFTYRLHNDILYIQSSMRCKHATSSRTPGARCCRARPNEQTPACARAQKPRSPPRPRSLLRRTVGECGRLGRRNRGAAQRFRGQGRATQVLPPSARGVTRAAAGGRTPQSNQQSKTAARFALGACRSGAEAEARGRRGKQGVGGGVPSRRATASFAACTRP